MIRPISYFLIFLLLSSCTDFKAPFTIENSKMVQFALKQIQLEQTKAGSSKIELNFYLDPQIGAQAYVINANKKKIEICGGDERGLMYGGLEVSEQLRIYGKVNSVSDSPYIINRGIKLNIPLDARTPSYDDSGDAAQQNIIEMWSWEFWVEYLDAMAINRYNVLSLWNPHPFPSMIKLDKFPDVALNDVCKTTYVPEGFENEMGDPQLVASNVIENLEVVKKISIDEKIEFWQKVMQYATDRGIDIYFITWNICPNSVAIPVKPGYKTFGINMEGEPIGKYGVTHSIDNPQTIKYHRAAVKQFLKTYPNIKGIGVTAGEHMPKKWNGKNREEWLWETYGLGIMDYKKENPERSIPFIHRVWHSDMEQIMKYWGDYPDSFEVCFKYAKARLYSSPKPQFHINHVKQMNEYRVKSWWNLRNDDIYVYRWGNTKYVRSFINNLPYESTKGIMMGSDGYVWGREFISKSAKLKGELEFKKHWMKFMLWGRLAYNPELNSELFEDWFNEKHTELRNTDFYQAWQATSQIIPLVNTYHWRNWDADWSIEQCSARPRLGGFRDVFDFVSNPTMEASGMLSPEDYIARKDVGMVSPIQVSDSILTIADRCLTNIDTYRNGVEDEATLCLIYDVEAMCHLGVYYANKIKCATAIAQYRKSKTVEDKLEAIKNIKLARGAALQYAAISKKNYRPQMTARAYIIDWDLFVDEVDKEIQLVKNMK